MTTDDDDDDDDADAIFAVFAVFAVAIVAKDIALGFDDAQQVIRALPSRKTSRGNAGDRRRSDW